MQVKNDHLFGLPVEHVSFVFAVTSHYGVSWQRDLWLYFGLVPLSTDKIFEELLTGSWHCTDWVLYGINRTDSWVFH